MAVITLRSPWQFYILEKIFSQANNLWHIYIYLGGSFPVGGFLPTDKDWRIYHADEEELEEP